MTVATFDSLRRKPVPVTGINHRDNVTYRSNLLTAHLPIEPLLKAGYMKIAKRYSYVKANVELRQADQRLRRADLKLSWDDDQIKQFCKARARECARIADRWPEEQAVERVRRILDQYGIELHEQSQADLFEYGFAPALARAGTEQWWRRQVRRIQRREVEELARSWRLVHNKGQIYCSDTTVKRRHYQKLGNRKLLRQMEAENQFGQTYRIDELSDLSVSNPKIRRSELMVRMRGFEDLADSMGYVGEFYTITCPSKYHSTKKGGIPNAKWNGASVREANEYLVNLFSRIRAAVNRSDLHTFGFRVAEPHHDGCPHWHILLFVDPERRAELRSLYSDYALKEDYGEWEQPSDRFKVEAIDKARGSATGYIAKYISKNIDGHGLTDDLYGHDAKNSARRIEAWASCHGIRQFQQIGGPSVTVWRELRRLGDEQQEGVIEKARKAADAADWAAFCILQGSGRGQTISLARLADIDEDTGEILSPVTNRYGERVTDRIVGLIGQGCAAITRLYRWTVKRIHQVAEKCKAGPVPGFSLVPGWVLGALPRCQCEECRAPGWVLGGSPPGGPPLEFCQ